MNKKEPIRYQKEDSKKCSTYCKYKSSVPNKCKKFKVRLDGINYITSPYSGGRDNYRCSQCLRLKGKSF